MPFTNHAGVTDKPSPAGLGKFTQYLKSLGVFVCGLGDRSVMVVEQNPGVEVPNDWEKMACSDTLLPVGAISGTGIDCCN